MSEALHSNEEQFVPSHVAAKQVGYTSDYVAKLAREKKIDGEKVGKAWLVSLTSLERFVQQAQNKKITRRENLRKERKRELARSLTQATAQTASSRIAHPITPDRGKLVALAQTFTVLLLGVCVGASGNFIFANGLTHADLLSPSFLNTVAATVYEAFSAHTGDRTASEATVVTALSSSDADTSTDGLKLSLTKRFGQHPTTSTTTLIRNAFSDDVDVRIDKNDPNIVVVSPRFGDGSSTSHRFEIVPVSRSGAALDGAASFHLVARDSGTSSGEDK